MEGPVWYIAVSLDTMSFHELGSSVFVVFSLIIGKGDGMRDESMREWVGQYGREMEWKSN